MSAFHPNHIFVSSFPMDMSPDPIYNYFNLNCGEVSYVSLHACGTQMFAIVQFANANDAHEASSSEHIIAGHKVYINKSNPNQIRSQLNLMDLNDDRLREILNRLDQVEYLANVARVSPRLEKLVHMVVSSKIIEFVVKSVQGAEIFLAELGRSIHSLRLVFDQLDQFSHADIFNLLRKYCGGTLVCLEMIGYDWPSLFGESTIRFLRMNKIIMKKCSVSIEIIMLCRELVELELTDSDITVCDVDAMRLELFGLKLTDSTVTGYDGNMQCPKLTSLKMNSGRFPNFHLFLRENAQLKTVWLRGELELPLNEMLVFNSLPSSIESLVISSMESTTLAQFTAINKLQLDRRFDLASVIERNTKTLEYFEFYGKKKKLSWETSNAIYKLTKLKTLKIYVSTGENYQFQRMIENLSELDELRISTSRNPFNESDLLNIIRHKHNLQLLCLGSRYNGNDPTKINHLRINASTYQKMLDFILLRSNRKPLHIVFVGPQHELTHIDVAFYMHPSLKITDQIMSGGRGIDEWISRYDSDRLQ